jgi:hypothetical protein
MLKLTFYVPEDYCEKVKEAVFLAGAGTIGNYDRCSFETPGTGQFRALPGALPTIGKVGIVEKISEMRVEMVLKDSILSEVIEALKNSHPYETPAYDVLKCMDI